MTLATNTPSAGGSFAPAEASDQFFTYLFARSVALESGMRQIRTDRASLEVPKVTSDAAANWTPEGDEITSSDPGTDLVTAVPRKLAALTYVTSELVSDSNPSAQDMVSESVARATALKLDLGIFEGTGTAPEITGLKNASGIQTVDAGGALSNLDPFASAIGLLEGVNSRASAIVMHPRNWEALIKIKETDTSNKPVLSQGDGSPTQGITRTVYGVPVSLSSQLSTVEGADSNANSIYVYDTSQTVVVIRNDVMVEVDRSVAFSSDRVAVRAKLRADLVLPNAEAVVRITGVTP